MAEMPEAVQEKIRQLQMKEQELRQLQMQKQTFQMQLMEAESALQELKETTEAYKIIGNVMILTKKDALETDLSEKKETAELRISSIEKLEAKTREKAEALQKDVIASMNK